MMLYPWYQAVQLFNLPFYALLINYSHSCPTTNKCTSASRFLPLAKCKLPTWQLYWLLQRLSLWLLHSSWRWTETLWYLWPDCWKRHPWRCCCTCHVHTAGVLGLCQQSARTGWLQASGRGLFVIVCWQTVTDSKKLHRVACTGWLQASRIAFL